MPLRVRKGIIRVRSLHWASRARRPRMISRTEAKGPTLSIVQPLQLKTQGTLTLSWSQTKSR